MQTDRTSPLPAKPRPGPGQEHARAASPADASALVALALEAMRESGASHKPEIVEWAVQATVHDPLRGLFVLAEAPSGSGSQAGDRPIGVAAFETLASAASGWSARLACLYVTPAARGRGVGRWLLGEALEAARYHGLNHLECAVEEGDPGLARLLEEAGFRGRRRLAFEQDLKPLYDDG